MVAMRIRTIYLYAVSYLFSRSTTDEDFHPPHRFKVVSSPPESGVIIKTNFLVTAYIALMVLKKADH